jgi:hypothetical protein
MANRKEKEVWIFVGTANAIIATFIIMIPTRYNPTANQELGEEIPPSVIEKIKLALQDNIGSFTITKAEGKWPELTSGQGARQRWHHDQDLLQIAMDLRVSFAADAWDYLTTNAHHWATDLQQECIYLRVNVQGYQMVYYIYTPGDERQEKYANPFRKSPPLFRRLLRRSHRRR